MDSLICTFMRTGQRVVLFELHIPLQVVSLSISENKCGVKELLPSATRLLLTLHTIKPKNVALELHFGSVFRDVSEISFQLLPIFQQIQTILRHVRSATLLPENINHDTSLEVTRMVGQARL